MFYITNFTDQNPWKPNGYLTSQEILDILWHLKVHYHVHKSLSLAPVLSQINPVHTAASYYFSEGFTCNRDI
jgi:hypothetical protein